MEKQLLQVQSKAMRSEDTKWQAQTSSPLLMTRRQWPEYHLKCVLIVVNQEREQQW
jgi:hypothetical protein